MCLSVTRVSLVKDCSHALAFLDGRFLQTAHRFFLTGLRGLSQDSPAPGALEVVLSLSFLHQLRRLPQGRSPCGRLSSPACPSPVRRALEAARARPLGLRSGRIRLLGAPISTGLSCPFLALPAGAVAVAHDCCLGDRSRPRWSRPVRRQDLQTARGCPRGARPEPAREHRCAPRDQNHEACHLGQKAFHF